MRRIAWFSMDVRKTLFALCLSRAGYRYPDLRPFTFPAKTVVVLRICSCHGLDHQLGSGTHVDRLKSR